MTALILSSRGGSFDRIELQAAIEIARRETGGTFDPHCHCKYWTHVGLFGQWTGHGKVSLDPMKQWAWADAYCKRRYGTWVKALRFHRAQGWW